MLYESLNWYLQKLPNSMQVSLIRQNRLLQNYDKFCVSEWVSDCCLMLSEQCYIMTRTSYIRRVFQLYHDKNKLHSTSVSAISWQEQVTFDECFSYHDKNKLHATSVSAISWQEQVTFDECFSYIMRRTSYIWQVFQLYHDKKNLHSTSVSAISWQEQLTFD